MTHQCLSWHAPNCAITTNSTWLHLLVPMMISQLFYSIYPCRRIMTSIIFSLASATHCDSTKRVSYFTEFVDQIYPMMICQYYLTVLDWWLVDKTYRNRYLQFMVVWKSSRQTLQAIIPVFVSRSLWRTRARHHYMYTCLTQKDGQR